MTVVITPVGTSLFTNGSEDNRTISERFRQLKDKPASQWDNYDRYRNNLETHSEQFIRDQGTSTSAELQSTAKIQNALESNITVYLLASDTIASRLAAEILRDQINRPNGILGDRVTAKFNDREDVICDLQVENSEDFSRKGMPNLFQRINDIKDWEAGGSQNLAINITGGYGATLPYLTIFAQLEDVPLYYNFEGTKELITIPRVPLTINSGLIESRADVLAQIADHMDDPIRWRTFKSQNEQAVKELDAFIWEDDDLGAELSPMGNIFWNDYLKSHFIVELPCKEYNASVYPNHCYYEMTEQQHNVIDNAIRDLHTRLRNVLGSPFPGPNECYNRIRGLGHNDDLNHTGQIQGRDIFIFTSTEGVGNTSQIRMLYTFEVNNQMIRRITIFAILYQKYKNFNHQTYHQEWKRRFGKNNQHGVYQDLPEIYFNICPFDVP